MSIARAVLSSLVVVGTTIMAAGCGGSGGISGEPLQGELDNMPWVFVGGSTNEFLSEHSDTFYTEMLAQDLGACSSSHSTQPYLLADLPKQVGSYDLGLDLTATFVIGTDNLVATDGEIEITKITAQTITGGIRAVFDDANGVDGQFQVAICTGPAAT